MLWLSSQQSPLTSGGAKRSGNYRKWEEKKKKKPYQKILFYLFLQQCKTYNFLKAEQSGKMVIPISQTNLLSYSQEFMFSFLF